MSPSAYQFVVSSPKFYELISAFSTLTGLTMRIMSAQTMSGKVWARPSGNLVCKLVTGTPRGCSVCQRVQMRLQQQCGGNPPHSCEILCIGGLLDLAVPVMADGERIATLVAGPVLARKPLRGENGEVADQLQIVINSAQRRKLEHAYLQTPVLSLGQRRAAQRLMVLFAEQIAACACRESDGPLHQFEPACVAFAKRYIEERLLENVRTHQVAQGAHLSLQHFCRTFHKVSGETFTHYLARRRVEKAKQLLANLQITISEAAFGSGFQSIPWFNRIFKRHTGQTPRQYRTALKTPDTCP